MVHKGVHLVVHVCSLELGIDWLHRSVEAIAVLRLEEQDAKARLVAEVAVP